MGHWRWEGLRLPPWRQSQSLLQSPSATVQIPEAVGKPALGQVQHQGLPAAVSVFPSLRSSALPSCSPSRGERERNAELLPPMPAREEACLHVPCQPGPRREPHVLARVGGREGARHGQGQFQRIWAICAGIGHRIQSKHLEPLKQKLS